MMLYLSFFNFIKITYIKKFKNSKIYKLKKNLEIFTRQLI